ncbi:MAG: hydroxypyruvate isomerase [Candidatus Poribacteria bacterium]|nr:MAG: hydroxypyruvate isomerase [Candidatus Poribacteria bacterium]
MGRIRQSICYGCFVRNGVTLEQVIEKAVALGYQSIEMAPRNAWGKIKDAGLEIAIVGGHGTLTNGLNKRENHDRIENELKANIDTAVEWGIPSLIAFSGNRDGLPDDEGIEICAEGLARVVPYAEEKGVTICMELLNSKVNHPDYQCDHTAWGVELCRRVNSPRFKLLYDIYHMQIMEGDLIRTITENIHYIGHFHTAGNPGRRDLDDAQEIYYPAVMRAIAGTDYDGFVGHEFVPKEDPLAAMEAAFRTCDVEA